MSLHRFNESTADGIRIELRRTRKGTIQVREFLDGAYETTSRKYVTCLARASTLLEQMTRELEEDQVEFDINWMRY